MVCAESSSSAPPPKRFRPAVGLQPAFDGTHYVTNNLWIHVACAYLYSNSSRRLNAEGMVYPQKRCGRDFRCKIYVCRCLCCQVQQPDESEGRQQNASFHSLAYSYLNTFCDFPFLRTIVRLRRPRAQPTLQIALLIFSKLFSFYSVRLYRCFPKNSVSLPTALSTYSGTQYVWMCRAPGMRNSSLSFVPVALLKHCSVI